MYTAFLLLECDRSSIRIPGYRQARYEDIQLAVNETRQYGDTRGVLLGGRCVYYVIVLRVDTHYRQLYVYIYILV